MIIFKQWGWLGNQIFHYCAIRSIMKPSEILILSGFEQLEELFDGVDAVFANKKSSRIKREFYKRFVRLTEILAEKKCITFITENEDQSLVIKNGKFRFLKFVHGAFFQYESILNGDIIKTLKIKNKYLKEAESVLSGLDIKNKKLFFLHVRRGDYLKWPEKNNPAVLPLEYYKYCMKVIRKNYQNSLFIITSDDKEYIKTHFSSEDSVYISSNSYTTDFALMTKCNGGILSASSFSWWASYFVHKQNIDAKLLAPEFWIGHRKKVWYPLHIKTSFLEYVNVEQL